MCQLKTKHLLLFSFVLAFFFFKEEAWALMASYYRDLEKERAGWSGGTWKALSHGTVQGRPGDFWLGEP